MDSKEKTMKFSGKTAFVFSGIGSQWKTMGSELYRSETVFRQKIDECDAKFSQYANWSIVEEITKEKSISRIDQSIIVHPCIFAIQTALFDLLRTWGLKPDAIIGHSGGEAAATHCAGVLDLKDAIHLVLHHNKIINKVIGKGKMAHIALPVQELEDYLSQYGQQVSIAAVNSPNATVLTGDEDVLKKIIAIVEEKNIFSRLLRIDIPFHSHFIEPYLEEFRQSLASIQVYPASIPVYSSYRGAMSNKNDYNMDYWAKHIRERVLFAQAINDMIHGGYKVFVEISPHPVLSASIHECFQEYNIKNYFIVDTLKRDESEKKSLLVSMATLDHAGFEIRWDKLNDEDQTTAKSLIKTLKDKEIPVVKNSLTHLSSQERKQFLADLITKSIEEISQGRLIPKDKQTGFLAMGLTSLMAIHLIKALRSKLQLSIPVTVLFNYPDIESLSNYLNSEIQNALFQNLEPNNYNARFSSRNQESDTQIAVVGMSCRFPGGADSPDSFWNLLIINRNGRKEIPRTRWKINPYLNFLSNKSGETVTRWANFISDESFLDIDAGFFKISPKEVEEMDPQQRLLLETSWKAFENAGIAVSHLKDKQVGVYVGICTFDFQSSVFDQQNLNRINQYSGSGAMYSCSAGRLSYCMNLHGPSLAIDTACSSSLVAIDLACQAINNNKAEIALVAGVNLLLTPHLFYYFTKLGALSPDGICKTFDASANGYARGEGCGAVILKRLSDALSDGDNILAVIRGTAVNHDGASSSFTAPNGIAQQQVIRDALNNANVLPQEISYVEAHGTGTSLGDPIEVNATGEVYSNGHDKDNPLIIGSVKANIGHLEGAAGISSLIKTILCLNNEYIPKQISFNEPNPYISWNEFPIKIPTENIHWPRTSKPRLAGISSFGFSGTNAHIIIEEAPQLKINKSEVEQQSYTLMISAQTEKALYALTERYEKFLETTKEDIESICYTADAGRTHFDYCLSVHGKSKKDIKEKLSNHLKNKTIVIKKLQEIKWQVSDSLYQKRKVVLPNYPFQRKRYEIKSVLSHPRPQLSFNDHQLIGRKVVSPALKDTIIFDSLFTDDQPEFLKEHIIFNQTISPAAAHIAMVLSAVNFHFDTNQCCIDNIDFINPLMIGKNQKRNVQLIFENTIHHNMPFKIVSSEHSDNEWIIHCEGNVITDQNLSSNVDYIDLSPDILKQRCQRSISGIEFHKKFASAGYQLGKHFQCIEQAWCGDNEAICELKIFPETDEFKPDDIHPGLIDSIFQSAMLTSIEKLDKIVTNHNILIPLNVHHFKLFSSNFTNIIITYAKSRPHKDYLESDIIGWNNDGTLLFEIKHFVLKETDKDTLFKQKSNLDQLLYCVEWEEKQAIKKQDIDHDFPAYLIFSDNSGTGTQLADDLTNKHINCIQVFKGSAFHQKNAHEFIVNPSSSEDFTCLFDTIFQNKFFNILFLWGLDTKLSENTTDLCIEKDLEYSCGSLLHLTQSIINYKWEHIPTLWILTRNACERIYPGTPINASQRVLLGMSRVIALEHPELWGGCFDLEEPISTACMDALLNETIIQSKDDQISLAKNGTCYVPRLKHYNFNASKKETIIKTNATYLITGGLGALGLLSAKWLVSSGCKNLVLIGRNNKKPDAKNQINALKKQGIQILEEQIDVSDKESLSTLFYKIQKDMPPLKGIIHAVGTLDDGILIQQNWSRFKKVMSAKVSGSWNIHQLTQNISLDFFVMFSSAASLTGNKGQVNYAAANAFMDGLAYYRRSKGLPATSINWGPWDAGMAAVDQKVKNKIFSQGFQLIQPEMGLEALNQVIWENRVQTGIMNFDLNVFLNRYPIEKVGFFSHFVHSKEQVKSKEKNGLLDQLKNALPEQRSSILLSLLQDLANEVAGYEISVDQPLMEQDFDSLMAVELRNSLNKKIDKSLPVSIFFDYPSLEMVVDYLLIDILQLKKSLGSDPNYSETIVDVQAAADFLEEIEGLI
jgi:acyl transferase domain-containing protein/short-subunit dehydrogenase/acyl carrier protein